MKLSLKDLPMEYLQGAPYTSILTREKEMHLLVHSAILVKVKFLMTNGEKKRKKQNYVL
jgi:hypothetical protein